MTVVEDSTETDVAYSPDELLSTDKLWSAITGFAEEAQGTLKSLNVTKTSLSFTVKVKVQSGSLTALFFDGGGEGSVAITLEWNHDA